MKKLTSILLVLVLLLALAACGGEPAGSKMVTIYIPDTVTAYSRDGNESYSFTYVYEEGWQDKESFCVTMSGDTDKLGSMTITYSEKKTTNEISDGAVTEQFFDDQGRETLMINNYADGGRREVTYTYDADGRLISEETKMYETADAEPVIDTKTYVYTATETGSTCTTENEPVTYITEYDKEGRRVSQVMYINGQERTRTEATYDDAGNMLGQVSYFDGQKNMEVKYTYKAVQVSEATAARFPQFKKAK